MTDIDKDDAILEITELTNNHIKGKFSGVIYNVVTETSISVLDGEYFC